MARSPHRLRIENLVSAGGVVYRHGQVGVDVVLCGRHDDGVLWGLPKGTPIAGETIEETALREVAEETGFDVEIERPLGSVEYWFSRPEQGVRFHKRVYHFLMLPVGGGFDKHDHEYDVVEWYPALEALQRLTYRNEAEIVQRAVNVLLPGSTAGATPDGEGRLPPTVEDRRRAHDARYRRRNR